MNACAYHPSEPAIGSCGECFRGICEACVRDRGRNLCAACIRGRRRTRTVLLALMGIVAVAVAGGVWESAMMDRYGAQTEHILALQEQLRRERCNGAAALELAERLLAAGVAREVPALVATYSAQCGRNEELVEKNYAAARRIGEWQRAITVATARKPHAAPPTSASLGKGVPSWSRPV